MTPPLAPTGRSTPASDVRAFLRGNVGALALVSLLNDAASEMIYPLLPLFLVGTLGAGPAFLGLVEGAAESISSLVKLAGGWLSDRLGRRKPLVAWGYAVAGAARPLTAAAAAPWHVLAIRLADRAGKGVRTAPRDALLADSVAPRRRGLAFGIHRGADHAGALLGPLLASLLLLAFPGRLRLVFALSAVPAVLLLAVLWRGVREIPPPSRAEGSVAAGGPQVGESGEGPASVGAVGRPPELSLRELGPGFLRYLAVLLLFTLGNASDAFLLLRAEGVGVPAAALPVLWAALHVAKVGSSVPGGALADRYTPGRLIVAGWLVYAAVYAGFAFVAAPWHVWALFAAYGLFHGLTEAPERALVAALAPAGLRARAFGAYHGAVGVGALPASVVFGLVWQTAGPAAAFALGAALAGAAAALLPLTLRRALAVRPPGG